MIPHFDRHGKPVVYYGSVAYDEVFVSQEQIAQPLAERNVSDVAVKSLWNALLDHQGVHYEDISARPQLYHGKLYSIRTLGPEPMVSANGLVNGITTDREFLRNHELHPAHIAQIGYIGLQFLPDAEPDIQYGMAILRSHIPEIGTHFDELMG